MGYAEISEITKKIEWKSDLEIGMMMWNVEYPGMNYIEIIVELIDWVSLKCIFEFLFLAIKVLSKNYTQLRNVFIKYPIRCHRKYVLNFLRLFFFFKFIP